MTFPQADPVAFRSDYIVVTDPQPGSNVVTLLWSSSCNTGAKNRISVQSAGVAQEVILRITQVRKHAKGIHPGFEIQGRRHQKSKTEVSVAPQKGLMSSKNLRKKEKKSNL